MLGKTLTGFVLATSVPLAASAAVTATTLNSPAGNGLAAQISSTDLLQGLLATELPGDGGWHPAASAATGVNLFTDGLNNAVLDNLLNDNLPNQPVKLLEYDLGGAKDISGLQVLGGNFSTDGRMFLTFRVLVSTDGGANFNPIDGVTISSGTNTQGYFESHRLGIVNPTDPSLNGGQAATLVRVGDTTGTLATGVTNIQFEFFSGDNTGGQYRDPFDGLNPFSGVDDGLSAAFVSPHVWEIDVFEVPEPTTVGLLLAGLGGAALRRRRA